MTRRLGHLAEYMAVLAIRALDRLLGPRLAGAMAARLGRLAYRPFGLRAGVVEEQLRRAFPDRDEEWVRHTAAASYAHLGREGMALLRLSRLGPDDVLAVTDVVEGLDTVRAAVAAGRGVVMVSGHFGNWEIGGAALSARGLPIDAVALRQANPYFDGLINRARARLGITVIRRGHATRAGLRSLRAGRVIALIADQDARGAGLFVPFFGRPASTYRGPAVLALRTGAPLFMGTAVRQPDGRYSIRMRQVEPPAEGSFDERVHAFTARVARALELAVRDAPGQYFWQHRRWKTAPPRGNGGGGEAVQGVTSSDLETGG